MINMTAMTTADIAAALETTPRTLRKFLRSEGSGVGKGARYALPGSKREITAMRKRFIAWGEALDAAKKAKSIDEVDNDATDDPSTDDAPTLDEMKHPLDD